jgi:Big-like domain-containing protein
MRHHAGCVGLLLGALLVLGGCEGPLNPDQCHNIRLAVVSPDPAVLQVGQEVTLQAQLVAGADCLPSDAQRGNLRWASNDSTIATTGSMTGQVRGIKAGTTWISLTTSVTHTFLTTSGVQVVGP